MVRTFWCYLFLLFSSFIELLLYITLFKTLSLFSCSLVCPHIALSFLAHPHIGFYYMCIVLLTKKIVFFVEIMCLFICHLAFSSSLIHPTLGSSQGSSLGVSHIALSPH